MKLREQGHTNLMVREAGFYWVREVHGPELMPNRHTTYTYVGPYEIARWDGSMWWLPGNPVAQTEEHIRCENARLSFPGFGDQPE